MGRSGEGEQCAAERGEGSSVGERGEGSSVGERGAVWGRGEQSGGEGSSVGRSGEGEQCAAERGEGSSLGGEGSSMGERGEGSSHNSCHFPDPSVCNHQSYSTCHNCSVAIEGLIDSFSSSMAAYMTGDSVNDEPGGGAQTRMVPVSSSTNLVKGFSKARDLLS